LVQHCLEVLERGGKLVFCGIGKSGHIGHKLAATLASTGSRAVFMHPVEAMHGDLGMLAEGDLLLAVSYSGETDELLAVLPSAKRLGVPVVAVTGAPESRLAHWSDLVVPMTVPREACPFNLAPTTTTTALLALGDALAIVLLECRRFGRDDYARLHPAGAIGRSITLRVTDIMRSGERFATVGPETPVREALLAMTAARCGAVAVVGQDQLLQGIFTDGDFRRQVTRDAAVLEAPIRTVMTARPIVIREDAMAIELVRILEERKIDDILVVDGLGRAVGLVDIQDLPRFKIM
jgi:arabinose-5-phosphate isomerase